MRSIQLLSGLCAVVLFLTGCEKAKAPAGAGKLLILCGNSMAAPVQEIGNAFAKEKGVTVEYDLAGSEALLPKVEVGTTADIYVCHDPFEEKVNKLGKLAGSTAVGYLEPVLAVRPGNPRDIHSLADLTKPGLKIGIGDPRYSTCGEMFVKMLKNQGLEDKVMANVALQARAHTEIANGMIVGPLDAIVVWNFISVLYKGKIEVIPTDARYEVTRVTVLGLKEAQNPTLRDAFLKYCAEPANIAIFEKAGYGRGK